jgi:hypothetical protein
MNLILAVVLCVLSLVATPAMADIPAFTDAACATAPAGTGPLVACADNLFINQAHGDTAAVNVTYWDTVLGTSLVFESSTFADLVGVAHAREQLAVSLAQI